MYLSIYHIVGKNHIIHEERTIYRVFFYFFSNRSYSILIYDQPKMLQIRFAILPI